MQVYIEYAFLQNFIIDALLLYLTLNISKQEISYKRIFISAFFGALFALVFPLFSLPKPLTFLSKCTCGIVLCFMASPQKCKGGKPVLSIVYFFTFTFLFGGTLIALYQLFNFDYFFSPNGYLIETQPLSFTLCGCILLTLIISKTARFLYFKRKKSNFYYKCEFLSQPSVVKAIGFLDSGNLATFQSFPVCFLSPNLAFKLITEGQVCDEMQIHTLNGTKKIKIFKSPPLKIYLDNGEHILKEIYFSSSVNLKNRDYQVLLSPLLFDEKI